MNNKIELWATLKFGVELDYKAVVPVGSKHVCSPPVESTDEDWLVLVGNFVSKELLKMQREGYKLDSSYNSRPFVSLRRGSLNLIVCTDLIFFLRFALAAKLSKDLNITDKTQRVALHNAIIGNDRFTLQDLHNIPNLLENWLNDY